MIVSHHDQLSVHWPRLAWDLFIARGGNLIPGISPNHRRWRDIDLLVIGLCHERLLPKSEYRGSWMDQSLFPKRNSYVAPLCRASVFINEGHRTIGPFQHGPSLRIADGKAIACIGCQIGGRCRGGLSRNRGGMRSRGRMATRCGWSSSGTSASQTASGQHKHEKEATQAQ